MNHYGDFESTNYCEVEGAICQDVEEELGEGWKLSDFTGCEEWYGNVCYCAYINYRSTSGTERTLIIQYKILKTTKDVQHFDFSYEREEYD